MKAKAWLSVLLAGLLLAGCSGKLLESKKIDYKSTGSIPPLDIPPDLTTPNRDDRYAVPDINAKGSATYSVYTGERSGQARASTSQEYLPDVGKMRIERSGTQRWLVVPGAPDKLWDDVKDFWQELGFIINVERPETGVMETDWAENRAKIPHDLIRSTIGQVFDDVYSTPERDKFRTRLEKGAEGFTEIYISHRGMYEVYITEGKDQTRWEPRAADPDLEAEMLRRLMVRLGVEESRAKAMLAEGPKQERAKMTTAGGTTKLVVQEGFDRAWRRVGLALDRVGFTVEDRDRSQGLYFVRYVDPEQDAKKKEDDKGFMSKLMFWKGDKGTVDQKIQYRLYIKSEGESSELQVLTREGGVDQSDTSKKILGLLFDQLK